MAGYQLEAWKDFALGHVGASAALLGLVFVGISINLSAIVRVRELINRAAESVVLLALVLFSSSAILLPGSEDASGVALVAIGAFAVVVVLLLQGGRTGVAASAAKSGTPRFANVARRVSGVGAALLVVVGGTTFLVGSGGGLYWWAAAVGLAYLGALGGAWVLLVEILR